MILTGTWFSCSRAMVFSMLLRVVVIQGAESHDHRLVANRRVHHRLMVYVPAEIDHRISVILQKNLYNIFAMSWISPFTVASTMVPLLTGASFQAAIFALITSNAACAAPAA